MKLEKQFQSKKNCQSKTNSYKRIKIKFDIKIK
jgi:hypothetical protein